jgi:hypothetical protein
MSQIKIETYNQAKHPNPMWYVDDARRQQHWQVPSLSDYKVCLVTVCSFTFIFHSIEQLALCLDYYRREHQPSSRLPVYTENLGGDHFETQRWFEKLPQYLLEKPKRLKVVKTLEKAMQEYSRVCSSSIGANRGT